MNDDARIWLKYAMENRAVAELCLENGHWNACLQNAQQSAEKALKSMVLHSGMHLVKTHSIMELKNLLLKGGFDTDLKDEDCDLLDAIYLPSKYPLGSVLPDFEPDISMAKKCVDLTDRVLISANKLLK
ncbi:MAG: HEPN domain-containing protein [Fibrobacterota bacterium]